jgi:hypothetical protein
MVDIETKRITDNANAPHEEAHEFESGEFDENSVEATRDFAAAEESEEETEQAELESAGVNDPISTYLREIGAVPLLSVEREIEEGKEIDYGHGQILV